MERERRPGPERRPRMRRRRARARRAASSGAATGGTSSKGVSTAIGGCQSTTAPAQGGRTAPARDGPPEPRACAGIPAPTRACAGAGQSRRPRARRSAVERLAARAGLDAAEAPVPVANEDAAHDRTAARVVADDAQLDDRLDPDALVVADIDVLMDRPAAADVELEARRRDAEDREAREEEGEARAAAVVRDGGRGEQAG